MKRSTQFVALLALSLTLLCLITLLAGWAILQLPAAAESGFGAPSESLGPWQTVYLSYRLLLQENELIKPYDPQGLDQPFQVMPSQSTQAIADKLQALGLVPSARALADYLIYAGLDTHLQAGQYTLSARMAPIEIAHALLDATPRQVTFVILPGWRLEEIAASLPSSGLSFTPQAFLASATGLTSGSPLAGELPDSATLEGFLFPDSYRLERNSTSEALVAILLENFHVKVDVKLRQGFQRQGLSLYQAVVLASIVQREAVVDDEMPLIASVFFNRLAAGMKLDSDPTVQYALGYNTAQSTWWTNPLSLENLQVSSLYNTYLNKGLPPGPIANPGLSALQAVASPVASPYFYFRAACDGSGRHTFAQTFQEHQANACP